MELNYIGKITQTHGLKGELKIKAETDFIDERFDVGAKVYYKDKDEYKELEVKTHRSMQGYELVSFLGFDDIDKVMFLRNKELYAEKDESLLDEDEYFYSDYIGLDVYQFDLLKGKVKDIDESFPQCDYLVIETLSGKEKLVPFIDEFISEVDPKNNKLIIENIEGLLDD